MRTRLAWLAAIAALTLITLWLPITDPEGARWLPGDALSEDHCIAKGRIWDKQHGDCFNETHPRAIGYLE